MNRDIVQSPGVERSAAYLAAIIYPLITWQCPRLRRALQQEEGRAQVPGSDEVSIPPRSFSGGFESKHGSNSAFNC